MRVLLVFCKNYYYKEIVMATKMMNDLLNSALQSEELAGLFEDLEKLKRDNEKFQKEVNAKLDYLIGMSLPK